MRLNLRTPGVDHFAVVAIKVYAPSLWPTSRASARATQARLPSSNRGPPPEPPSLIGRAAAISGTAARGYVANRTANSQLYDAFRDLYAVRSMCRLLTQKRQGRRRAVGGDRRFAWVSRSPWCATYPRPCYGLRPKHDRVVPLPALSADTLEWSCPDSEC